MSTKIVVVKLKEVGKTSVLAILGIIVLCCIIYLFMPNISTAKPDLNNQSTSIINNQTPENLFKAGTYSSEIVLHSNPVSIKVTVSENKILEVSMINLAETQEVFYPLFGRSIDEIASKIIEHQSTDILYTSDSPYTDEIILEAVENALKNARI